MLRLLLVIMLVAVVAGGIFFWANFKAEVHRGEDGVEYIKISPRDGKSFPLLSGGSADRQPHKPLRGPIRIATFNLDRLNDRKLANRRVCDVLVHLVPNFELIAVQGVQSKNQGVLVKLVQEVNATGQKYEFAVCPAVKRDSIPNYSGFLFDSTSIEIDRSTLRWVEDPHERFRHKPLMALFRVRGPDRAEAFTFRLVNVHTDKDRTAVESGLLDEVYRAARDAVPHEDDIIVLGELGADEDRLAELSRTLHLTSSLTGTPVAVRGGPLSDSILFNPRATAEFTGRSEVMDLMRKFDLTAAGAREVSSHLPVWAEFSPYEGGQSGHVAGKPGQKLGDDP